jgi:hypothetical protein
LSRHVVADIETDQQWQTGQERLTEVSIASEIPADELGYLAAASNPRLEATFEKAWKGVAHVERRCEAEQAALRAELVELWSAHNAATAAGRTAVDAEYLDVVATRA